MSAPPPRQTLRELALLGGAASRFIADENARVPLAGLARGTALGPVLPALHGQCVLIIAAGQLPAVLACLDLDGVAGRILLCPPDLPAAHLPAVVAEAGVAWVATDGTGPAPPPDLPVAAINRTPLPPPAPPGPPVDTEWVLFTSGTTGRPKLVRHTLGSLTGPLQDGATVPDGAVWSTFYDVRRYGGLQILLRALLGGGSMVLSGGGGENVAAFLGRAGTEGVSHISGTPSHWRRALMSPAAAAMAPRYVRLSGEVADQPILDQLAQAYAGAGVAHAFASTEAGVAFDVRDGLAGFPAAMLDGGAGLAEMRVQDGTLWVRSRRVATGYVGGGALPADDGFVDTGDRVERRGDRFFFLGRREGVINVGGRKVFPEEVEAVLNAHPAVRLSLVRPRPSPAVGSIVAADIVLHDPAGDFAAIRAELLRACQAALPPFKVPATLRRVDALPITEAGKLARPHA